MKPYLARALSLVGILAFTLPPAAFAQDADSDFLSDAEELGLGTNPYDKDSDGDGLLDRDEVYPFQTVAGTFTYDAALSNAASKGGRLVVIDSLNKLYKVKRGLLTTALPSPLPNNYDPFVTLTAALWSGGQDIRNDGQYQWADYGSTLANPVNLSELGAAVFGDLAPGSNTVSNVVNIAALTVGRPFVASGVPSGTTITAINSAARTLTLSQPVGSVISQKISRVVLSNGGYGYTSPPVVSFSGGAVGLSSITMTAGGSLYTIPPTVSFVGGTGGAATAIATISGGAVTGVTLTSIGSYTVVPTTVVFTPVGGGSGAAANISIGATPTADATLSPDGRIQSITVTGDGGVYYTAPPTVTLSGGSGGGALASAVLTPSLSNNLSAINVTAVGTSYATPPTVTLTGGGGAGATAVAVVTALKVSSIVITNPGTGYTSAPTVTLAGGGGSGAAATAVFTPASSGSVSLASVTATGTGYTAIPTVTITGGGGTGATATASINSAGEVTGIVILNAGLGYNTAPAISIVGVGTGATATASIRQFSARASSPVPGSYVNWLSDLLPGNRVASQEGVFLSIGSVFTWETAQVTTLRGYLLERRPTNPTNSDTDGDGLNDSFELANGFNPTSADSDGDGISDMNEGSVSLLDLPKLESAPKTVSIPQSYTPFGNRSDTNRFGDDGSALLSDVNGMMLWEDNLGVVRVIPATQYASPLMVSSTEAVIWMNAFDPARTTSPAANPIKVGFYRLDESGLVGVPKILSLLGTDIIPTAPITSTKQGYSVVTLGNIGDDETGFLTPKYFIYRLTYDLQAQLLGQIDGTNYDPKTTAGPMVSALGHGSDGSLVFSVDKIQVNNPDKKDRKLFWVNGSRPGPSGIWVELRRVNGLDIHANAARVLYTSQTRVLYQLEGAGGKIYDARRNSFTGYLSADEEFLKGGASSATPTGYSSELASFLNVSTQTKEGNRVWIYGLNATNDKVLACLLDEDSLDLKYRADLGKNLYASARVEKINPEDGSALITSDNIEELLWVHNTTPNVTVTAPVTPQPSETNNITKVTNSRLARSLFVSGKELVLWNNATAPIGGNGNLNPVEVLHHVYNTTTGALQSTSDLSSQVVGNYVLNTPPFTPGADYWRFMTAEKTGTATAVVRNYILLRRDTTADDDGDRLSNAEEVTPDPSRPYPVSITDIGDPDTDSDGILDGLEVHPFRIINGDFTLEEARLDAIRRGGRLTVLNTAAKMDQLKKQLLNDNSGRRLWLGGGDMEGGIEPANSREGNYQWVDAFGGFFNTAGVRTSAPITVFNWATGQPKNTGNADGLQLDGNYKWSLELVSQKQGYVLELPATNPALADTDGDGYSDGQEIINGTSPVSSDTDGDGISDGQEIINGTNPKSSDTDGDGLSDSQEIANSSNPLLPDTDTDGLSDGQEVNGISGFTSDPLLVDTDGDGATDFNEVKAVPPTNPRDGSSVPPPSFTGAKHSRVVTYQAAQTVTIASSYAPFGQRPDTDKIGDDGSVAVRDRNGVLLWSNKLGNAVVLPNSALAQTLYVSDTECVVYNNRYAADHDIWGSKSDIIIYRRNTNGTLTASPTISVRGTLLDTSPVTPNSYGFTIVSAYGWNFSTDESTQVTQSGSNADGPTYTTARVDQWHNINYEQYRITWDGVLQTLRFTTVDVPKTNTNLGGTDVIANGDDGSFIMNATVAANYFASEASGTVFRTRTATLWATWQINSERISRFTTTAGDGAREAAYVSNSRVLLENVGLADETWISDFRMRPNGILDFAGRSDLALGESVLPVSNYTRGGLPPYVYTVDTTGTLLRLYRYDATLAPLGGAVRLPSKVIGGSKFVRNPRDASLLIKSEGVGGVLWIPSTGYSATTAVTGLGFPKSLPNSSLGLPMFVSSSEAVAWMNSGASVNLGAGGTLPPAQISHFSVSTSLSGTIVTSLTPPIVGTYVALPSPLTSDPDSEGWFITSFKKTSDRAAQIFSYQLLEQDTDGDGLSDRLEGSYGTNPLVRDTDGDGLSDGSEVNQGTNPLNGDTDGDGLPDGEEIALGTDPSQEDSDGDGRLDGAEVNAGSNPLVADKTDTDGDGVSDDDEVSQTQTDPLTPSFGPGTATGVIPFSSTMVSGDYSGLVFDPKSGQSFKQNLRLSSNGSFTSSLLGLVADTSLKGTFSATGAFTGVPDTKSGLISVQMNLVKYGVAKYYVEGNFKTRTGGTLYFQLRHTLYSKSYGYAQAGKVTFEAALSNGNSGPSGSAVATGSISASGQVSFQIYLPDGSGSSYSGPIVDGGLIPLFSRSKSRTVLLGVLKLEDVVGESDFAGSARLFSAAGVAGGTFPSGFDQPRKLTGSRYYPPVTGVLPLTSFVPTANNLVFNWLGGNFEGVQKVGTWATNGKMTVPATQIDKVSPSFTSSSGLLSFSYTRTDATRSLVKAVAKGYAVVVQKSKTFKGYYTSGLSAADFVVEPNTAGINPEITSVSPLNKSVNSEAISYTVTVGTAGEWSVVIPSSVTWLTATVTSASGVDGAIVTGPSNKTLGKGNGTVVITVALNKTYSRREGEITIAGLKHTIKQDFR